MLVPFLVCIFSLQFSSMRRPPLFYIMVFLILDEVRPPPPLISPGMCICVSVFAYACFSNVFGPGRGSDCTR